MHPPTAVGSDGSPGPRHLRHADDPVIDRDKVAPSDRPQGLRMRVAVAFRCAGPALLLYLVVRVVGVLTLWIFASHAGVSVIDVLAKHYDSIWYTNIAQHGYDYVLHTNPNGSLKTTDLTFFPLYPALIALTSTVTFLPAPIAGLAVAWLAGIAAAWGIFAVGNRLFDRRTGILLVALWGVLPHAVVESMAYTETVFTALVAWALFAVLRRHWLTAAGLTVLAGLSRPTAVPLVAAVCLAALVAVIQRRDGWRPWVAMIAAPIGYVAYIAWIDARVGRGLGGYFYIQKNAWNIAFDGGVDTARTFRDVLTKPESLTYYMSALLMVLAVALLVLTILDRQPWPMLVYTLTLIILTVGTSHYFWTKGRYLIPAFPLLIPIAVGLARARPRTTGVVLTFLTLFSAWFGTYQSLVWIHSP